MDYTVLSANTPCLPFLRKRLPDGATPNSGRRHSIYRPIIHRPRRDERLNWPGWLTYNGRFTHISGHPSATGGAQDRKSSPAKDRRSAAVPRHATNLLNMAWFLALCLSPGNSLLSSWCDRSVLAS